MVRGELCTQVLHNINLDLRKGQIYSMTGPSGSGKTTLLSLIEPYGQPTQAA